MAATVQINEFNTAGETKTANITNCNMGSSDSVNLDPVAYPVTPGDYTYEKWQKVEVTAMGGSSRIDNLKIWRTNALGGSAAHLTNARETSYGGAETFSTPVVTVSSIATQTMPSTEPTDANLGIGGSLTGTLDTTGSSDYLVHQIGTDAGDVAGSTSTMNYQYDKRKLSLRGVILFVNTWLITMKPLLRAISWEVVRSKRIDPVTTEALCRNSGLNPLLYAEPLFI